VAAAVRAPRVEVAAPRGQNRWWSALTSGKSKKVSSEPYLPETRASLSVVLTTMVYSHHDGFFHTLFG